MGLAGRAVRRVSTAVIVAAATAAAMLPLAGCDTPASASAGWFSVDSRGGIHDPNGKAFVPVGVNANGPAWVWPDPTIGESAEMAKWHFNALRVNACLQAGCPNLPVWHQNDDLDRIVAEYTAKHYVIIIGQMMWGADNGQWPSHLPELRSWWVSTARRYATNPYVWFNLENEPTIGLDSDTAIDFPKWQQLVGTLAPAIRHVAPQNVLVVDGGTYGQDKGSWTCDGADWPRASTILNLGASVERAYRPVVFSTHVYGMWGGNEAYGCTTSDWSRNFTAYLDAVRTQGLPLLLGETGATVNKADETWASGGSWNAVRMLSKVLPARTHKVGLLYWHGSDGSGGTLFASRAAWTSYPNPDVGLSWIGSFVRSYAKQINP